MTTGIFRFTSVCQSFRTECLRCGSRILYDRIKKMGDQDIAFHPPGLDAYFHMDECSGLARIAGGRSTIRIVATKSRFIKSWNTILFDDPQYI